MKRLYRALAVVLVVAVAAGAGLLLRRWAFGTVRVAGVSMRETLQNGDVVLVTRLDAALHPPCRGDVVECRFPGRADTYVKRVIGLPGERIAFMDGQLTVDGAPVDEPYASSATEDYAVTLGEDEYLALGDNRAESYDGRMDDMGPIHAADILGRARWILYPLGRFGPIH